MTVCFLTKSIQTSESQLTRVRVFIVAVSLIKTSVLPNMRILLLLPQPPLKPSETFDAI